jgi:four helix bundle protein
MRPELRIRPKQRECPERRGKPKERSWLRAAEVGITRAIQWCRVLPLAATKWRHAPRNLNVLDAAELAAERLNRLIDRIGHRRLLHVAQMRDSAQSVSANISEGFGRATRAERDNKLRLARGVAEETLCRLRANLRVDRITKRDYWPVYNLFRAVIKMLDELLNQ